MQGFWLAANDFIIYQLEKDALKSDSKGIVWTFPGVDESKW